MSSIDLFTYVLLAVGLILGFLLFFAKKRNKFIAQNFRHCSTPTDIVMDRFWQSAEEKG